jgi:hypothetical protein
MRIFGYLQGILQFKLRFRGLPPQDLVGYCDADWAGDLKIGDPPQGLYSQWEVKPFPGVAKDNPQSLY